MEKIIKKRWFRFVLALVCAVVLYLLIDLIMSKWIFYTEFHPDTSAVTSRSEAISAYCNYVNSKKEKLASAGLEDIIVTITFSKPLNKAAYESYIKAYDIRDAVYKLRGVQPDGTRTTGGAWHFWTGVGDSDENQSKLIGAVSMHGYIDSKNLLAAISDPNSYLVDTSRDAYWGGLFRPKGESRNNWTKGRSPAEIFNRDVAWQLEDHGIAGYSYYLPYQEIAKEKARLNSLPAE